jgi:hypothetical protein
MSAAANEAPKCTKCYARASASDCAGWCTTCYYAAIAKLSVRQLALMCRAFEAGAEDPSLSSRFSIVLERHELAAARGLVHRKLARTYRPSKRSWSARPNYLPGSRRELTLTPAGVAFVEKMAPERRAWLLQKPVQPVDLEEALALARDLARDVLHYEAAGTFLHNRARGVLERLAGDADREDGGEQ